MTAGDGDVASVGKRAGFVSQLVAISEWVRSPRSARDLFLESQTLWEREREKERERNRQTDRQTDSQTDRQTDRQTVTETDTDDRDRDRDQRQRQTVHRQKVSESDGKTKTNTERASSLVSETSWSYFDTLTETETQCWCVEEDSSQRVLCSNQSIFDSSSSGTYYQYSETPPSIDPLCQTPKPHQHSLLSHLSVMHNNS